LRETDRGGSWIRSMGQGERKDEALEPDPLTWSTVL
jgi:hypothetical protein